MEQVAVHINGKEVKVKKGASILDAARSAGIRIPTLCHRDDLTVSGACRICVVEVEGMRGLVPSCAFPVSDGMKVSTHSERVRRARKTIVELLLANHPGDCLVCVRCGDCELQNLAREFGVREYRYLGEKRKYKIDTSSASIERDPNKCILCGRCVKICEEIQATGAIDFTLRGFNTIVLPAFNRQLADAACVNCGQCIVGCPTAALREKSALREVWAAINDPKKHVIFQIAPAIRVALGEEFGLPAGTDVTGKIPSALRRIGADKVFDTNFTADLTIMEEASELVQRLTKGGPIPLITSCSPGWVKYMEHFFSELIPNVSTCKSPHMMLGALAKTYYAEKEGLDPEHVFVVSVMPCTAKKYEITRPEMEHDGLRDVDAVLTTRELGRMLTVAGIHFDDLQDEEFDHPMGESTGAADIFGTTGGVAEAALRTGYYFVTGQELGTVDFQEIRGAQGIKETTVKVGDIELRVAVASGLRNARKLCKEAAAGNSPYHLIEIMGCPGGCVNGGGQPIAKNADAVKARRKTLYDIDANKPKRQSHQNTEIQQIYRDFLGEPLGQKSHHLLHTTYRARERG